MSTLSQIAADIGTTMNFSLVLATVWIINKEFARHTASPVTITQYATNSRSWLHHNDLIDAILRRAANQRGGWQMKFFLRGVNIYQQGLNVHGHDEEMDENLLISTLYLNRNTAIWLLDSLEAFNYLEADLLDPHSGYHRNGHFCIIYTGNERDTLESINVMFHRLFAIYVTNVNVLVGSSPDVFTYFPFRYNQCHSSKPHHYLSFRDINEHQEFSITKNFFPNKIFNMYNCTLLVTAWEQPPYVYVEVNNQTGELIRLHGIEGLLLSLLAEQMHFKIAIATPATLDRGIIFDNGTGTGATGMIINGETNITLGAYMYSKRRAEVMLAANSHLSSVFLIAIPIGQPMTPFVRLTRPFKYIIWACFSSSILLGISVIFILRLLGKPKLISFVFGHGNHRPLTNLLKALLEGHIHGRLPSRNFARYLLTIWLLYTLIMRCAYTGELFILLQDGRARTTMQTINEVVAQNYTFYMAPLLKDIVGSSIKSENFRYTDSQNHTLLNVMARLQAGEKFVVALLEYTVNSLNQHARNYNHRIRVLPEKLCTVPLTMYMRKHSYLSHRMNRLLLNIMSAGILSKFEGIYLDSNFDHVKHSRQPVELSLWLICGIFSVYFVLLFFAFLVFLLELCSRRTHLLRRILNFCNC